MPGMQGGGRVRLTPPGPLTYSALPGSTDGVTGAPAHTQPSQGTHNVGFRRYVVERIPRGERASEAGACVCACDGKRHVSLESP